MNQAATAPVLDLSTCDKEPIRTPGSIQPHGFLLTLDADLAVLQASANLADWTGVAAIDAIGRPLAFVLGRPDLGNVDPIDHLFALTEASPDRDHVYTLHAELEGNLYLDSFERLLRGWRSRGAELMDMAVYASTLSLAQLPRCEMVEGTVEGRSGLLAVQGAAL